MPPCAQRLPPGAWHAAHRRHHGLTSASAGLEKRVYFAYPLGLHIATALPNFLTYEYMQSDWSKDQPNPLRHELVQDPIEIFADGYMQPPPNKPGLGIELNEHILQKYAVG
jgi:L-alanine-DL-glutamate epimerase-like enolase superfamily enzyme